MPALWAKSETPFVHGSFSKQPNSREELEGVMAIYARRAAASGSADQCFTIPCCSQPFDGIGCLACILSVCGRTCLSKCADAAFWEMGLVSH